MRLVPVSGSDEPYNAETPLPALADAVTPSPLVFVRTNFPIPRLEAAAHRVAVGGALANPRTWSLAELAALPQRELAVTIECAGNGRKAMRPVPEGTPWGYGAVSTAVFAGPALAEVLAGAQLDPGVRELLFVGADRDPAAPLNMEPFARSLPLATATHPDTLVALRMNGAPLTAEHGAPVRLVVPGWYGIASVKWLVRIEATRQPFAGYFQRERYVYDGDPRFSDGAPVQQTHVRALVATPADGALLRRGAVEVAGSAWSGHGPVTRVEFSSDAGRSWADAALTPGASPYAAATWRVVWTPPAAGEYILSARATDAAGCAQPLDPVWNRLGYGNNGVQRVRVRVE